VDENFNPAHNRNAAGRARGVGQANERSSTMDFFRNMQPKDWMIAAVAFLAGAIIF
jgi:hypothetical protein